MQDVSFSCQSHMNCIIRLGGTSRLTRTSKIIVRSLSEGMESRLKLFQDIGLSEQKARETAKNEKLTCNLEFIVNQVGLFLCHSSNRSFICCY